MEFTKNINKKLIKVYTEIYNHIDMIDPVDEFHIGHFRTIKNDNSYDLQFAHGGLSLEKVDYVAVDSVKFLAGFENIFRAVAVFNTHDVYHSDIKTPNICMNVDYTFKLIDFGISFAVTKPFTTMPIFSTFYSYWPPEAILLSNHTPELIATHINKCVSDPYLQNILPYAKQSDFRSVITTCIDSLEYSMASRHTICKRLDIYGLGLTLFDITHRLEHAHGTLKIGDDLRKLAYLMTHPKIHRRPGINDAHRTYHLIINSA
jgi:serine/threonine protein kinase